MPAYLLFIREAAIRDQDAMNTYSRMNREHPSDPKLKPLVIYGGIEALEGDPADGIVMLEFPTAEDAKAWYHSPGYQAALRYRKNGADYRVMLVQGL